MDSVMERIAGAIYEQSEEDFKRMFIGRLGSAPHREWVCEDGWIVGYTTGRLYGGDTEGKFAAFAYKPVGKGARSGKADNHKLSVWTVRATRKAAKKRALEMYYQHSPKARGDGDPRALAAAAVSWA
jgi:hypothetical protein